MTVILEETSLPTLTDTIEADTRGAVLTPP